MKGALAVLRAIERKHGQLTAEALVVEARDPKHPWHSRFNWNDKEAAHQHRLDQARVFIRQVKVEVVTEVAIYRSVAFVRDPDLDHNEQGYVGVVQLKTDKDRAIEALLNEFSRVASMLRRARDIGMTLGLEKEISRMILDVEGMAAMVRRRSRPGEGPRVAA